MKRKLLGAASVLVLTAAAAGIAWSQGAGSQLVTTLSSSYRVPIKAGNGTVNQETTLGTLSAFIGAGPGGGSAGVAGDIQTSDGTSGFTALTPGGGIATWIASPSGANLLAALTTKTGTGLPVFGTSPTLTTPNLGTPSAATLTNATGLPISGMAAVAANTLLGNPTGSSAIPNTITLGTNLSFSGGVLNAAGGSGTPGGSNGQFQYNNAGVFAGGTVGTGLDLTAGNLTLVTVPNNQSGASYTLQTTDTNKSVNMTNVSATTVTALLAATAGTNYGTYLYCKASCTLTHSGSDTINGGASLALAAGQAAYLTSDGTSAWTVNILPALDPSNGANLQAGSVANAALATMAAHTHKGNNTGSTGAPLDLTSTQLTADLNAVVGDSGSGGTKGLVPAPAAGDAAAGKVLGAGGGWIVASGGSPGGSNGYIQYKNGSAFGGYAPLGIGTVIPTVTGLFTPGNAVVTNSDGTMIDSGLVPGGGGGSGTVSSGAANQLGRYASTGPTITGSATFTDDNTKGAVTKGFVLSGLIAPTALSGTTNDYNPANLATSSRIELNPGSGGNTLTGIVAQPAGTVISIFNPSATDILTVANNTGSSSGNRFFLTGDIAIRPKASREFTWSTSANGWVLKGAAVENTVTAGSCSPCAATFGIDGRATAYSTVTASGSSPIVFGGTLSTSNLFVGTAGGGTHGTSRPIMILDNGTVNGLRCRESAAPGAGITHTITLSRAAGEASAAPESNQQVQTSGNTSTLSTVVTNTGVSVSAGDNLTMNVAVSSGISTAGLSCTIRFTPS